MISHWGPHPTSPNDNATAFLDGQLRDLKEDLSVCVCVFVCVCMHMLRERHYDFMLLRKSIELGAIARASNSCSCSS